MKYFKTIYIPLFAISFITCSGKKEIDEDKLQIRNGIAYEVNQQAPFSGKVISYYDNKQQKCDISYKNGEKYGSSIEWHKNGQTKNKGSLIGDNKTGLWTHWYENGLKWKEEIFKDGTLDGVFREWDENGQLIKEYNFLLSKENGLWSEWYENGQKHIEGRWVDGKQNGTWVSWYKNGLKKASSTYKYGEKDSICISWYENGQKQDSTTYVNGRQIGLRIFWLMNGDIFTSFYPENIANPEERIKLKAVVVNENISLNQVFLFHVMFCYPIDDFRVYSFDNPKVKYLDLAGTINSKSLVSGIVIKSIFYKYKPIKIGKASIESMEIKLVNQSNYIKTLGSNDFVLDIAKSNHVPR